MRQLFPLVLVSLMACGLSQEAYEEQSLTESCRILTACEFYESEAACLSEVGISSEGCVFDADQGQACLDGLAAIEGCPDPFAFPEACATVYTCDGSDSGV